jgi:hypothetical protein
MTVLEPANREPEDPVVADLVTGHGRELVVVVDHLEHALEYADLVPARAKALASGRPNTSISQAAGSSSIARRMRSLTRRDLSW